MDIDLLREQIRFAYENITESDDPDPEMIYSKQSRYTEAPCLAREAYVLVLQPAQKCSYGQEEEADSRWNKISG